MLHSHVLCRESNCNVLIVSYRLVLCDCFYHIAIVYNYVYVLYIVRCGIQ